MRIIKVTGVRACSLSIAPRILYLLMKSLVFFILTSVLICACGRSESSGNRAIVVSTPALGRIVEELMGSDSVEIVTLIPAGADPEHFEPDMAVMKKAAGGSMFLSLNTVGFERELGHRLHGAVPDLPTIDLSEGIELLRGSHSGNEADPHLLSSPKNARIVLKNTAAALSDRFPELAAGITRRSQSLDSLLAERDICIKNNLKGKSGKAFVVIHPSLSYFARDYGLRQVALERDGKEPTPRQYRERLREAAASGATLIVAERSTDPERIAELARELELNTFDADFNAADFIEQYCTLAEKL